MANDRQPKPKGRRLPTETSAIAVATTPKSAVTLTRFRNSASTVTILAIRQPREARPIARVLTTPQTLPVGSRELSLITTRSREADGMPSPAGSVRRIGEQAGSLPLRGAFLGGLLPASASQIERSDKRLVRHRIEDQQVRVTVLLQAVSTG